MSEVVTQFVALITFFAFPAFQYFILKRFAKREGRPELWYLPAYGFRLVVHNMSGKRTLSDIRYRVMVRRMIPSSAGASVATWDDTHLLNRDEFFVFPGNDQVLLSFKLDHGVAGFELIHTTKVGGELSRVVLPEKSMLIADYSANVENILNFDIKLAKRAEVRTEQLIAAYEAVNRHNAEQEFAISRIRDGG